MIRVCHHARYRIIPNCQRFTILEPCEDALRRRHWCCTRVGEIIYPHPSKVGGSITRRDPGFLYIRLINYTYPHVEKVRDIS